MKMKKLARVFTSAVLVGAMVATMGGMTALAAEFDPIPLTKEVTTDGHTYAPNTTFTFEISVPETVSKAGVTSDENLSFYVGETGGLYFSKQGDTKIYNATTTFEAGDTVSSSYNSEEDIKVQVDIAAFTQPGIYQYKIQEKNDQAPGIDYDTAARNVYVYVQRLGNGNLEASSVIMIEEGKEGKIEKLAFSNNYGADRPGKEDKVYDLTVKKEVEGNQGDTNTSFNFTISIAAKTGENVKQEKYEVTKYTRGENGTFVSEVISQPLTSGGQMGIALKDDEYFVVNGLTEDDIYTIVEAEANSSGYETTFKKDGGNEETYGEGGVTGAANKNGATVTIINTKTVTTPTGIVLSFAPYILLVALAGVFGVLFLRRRKEEF